MFCPEETFTLEEVNELLLVHGLKKDSDFYFRVRSERFICVGDGMWIEHPDFEISTSVSPRQYTTAEVDQEILSRGLEPDFNTRAEYFTPYQADGEMWVRREDSPFLSGENDQSNRHYDVV